ncbi:hypothetical protein C7S15_6355 [Burkholderia cepacia]|nr:hypothetical protein [Burkholderia cepacia]
MLRRRRSRGASPHPMRAARNAGPRMRPAAKGRARKSSD